MLPVIDTFEEIKLGCISNKDIDDLNETELVNIETYGTSCDLDYKKANKSLKFFMRRNPKVIIITGQSRHGLSQKIYNRTKNKKHKKYLDWWIYKNCDNNSILNFSEYKIDIEE